MVKIKTKKQLNLPQLIEWAWDNDITNKEYICNEFKKKSIIFNLSGWAEFSDEFSYNPEDTFTVEVVEEITEETVLSKVLIVFKNESTEFIEGLSVEDIYKSSVDSIYHVRNDKAMILIWTREKGLVE